MSYMFVTVKHLEATPKGGESSLLVMGTPLSRKASQLHWTVHELRLCSSVSDTVAASVADTSKTRWIKQGTVTEQTLSNSPAFQSQR